MDMYKIDIGSFTQSLKSLVVIPSRTVGAPRSLEAYTSCMRNGMGHGRSTEQPMLGNNMQSVWLLMSCSANLGASSHEPCLHSPI